MSGMIRSRYVLMCYDTIPAGAYSLLLSVYLQKKLGLEILMWYFLKFDFRKLKVMEVLRAVFHTAVSYSKLLCLILNSMIRQIMNMF